MTVKPPFTHEQMLNEFDRFMKKYFNAKQFQPFVKDERNEP